MTEIFFKISDWSFSIVLQLSSGYMGKDYHLPKTTNPEELEIIFADCEKYNTPHLFGGPVCGNDSLTYNNVLYLHCINFGKSSSESEYKLQVHQDNYNSSYFNQLP